MKIRSIVLLLGASLLVPAIVFAASDGKAKNYQAPTTEFGHPELRGVWNFSSNTPLQRPEQYGDREFLTQAEVDEIHAGRIARSEASDNSTGGGVGGYNQFWVESLAQDDNYRTSLIVDPPDGRMPPMVKGAVVQRGGLGPDSGGDRPVRFRVGGVRKDGPEDRGLSERCLMGFNSGPPFMPSMYNNNVQIFQTKNHVVLMTEMIHDARVVPIDGRPMVDDAISRWSGESRGHWEGDTLVVETKNFTDKIQSFRSAGIASNMTLIERFTRTGPDNVEYKFTVNDPSTFSKPITVLVPMVRAEEIYEYACHEGNYGMFNMLGGARNEEREATKQ